MNPRADVQLTATRVAVERDGDMLIVGLADFTAEPSWQLIFIDADHYDAQDIALGQDTYCIVSGDQQGTVYGGVVDWRAAGATIHLTLTDRAASELGLWSHVAIELVGSPAETEAVVAALGSMFARSGR